MVRDFDRAEVSFPAKTDELITSTNPTANDLLPVGREGKHAISCNTCE